jgi:mono/diheme cytochrome c family protein
MSEHNPELEPPHVPHPDTAIGPDAPDFIETPDVPPIPESREPLPLWIFVACGLALFMAGSSFTGFNTFGLGLYDQGPGGPSVSTGNTQEVAVTDPATLGKKLYNGNCANCHHADGEGQPGTYPPLGGSEWVLGSKQRLAAILLHGISGPFTARGGSYGSAVMPAWGTNFTDDQLADLMTYIRKSWGNTASDVQAADVTAARAKFGTKADAYCQADLMGIAPNGPDPSDKK